jgi:hypothetical protein
VRCSSLVGEVGVLCVVCCVWCLVCGVLCVVCCVWWDERDGMNVDVVDVVG